MFHTLSIKRFVSAVAFAFGLSGSAAHAEDLQPVLHSTAGDLAAACAPDELAKLRSQIFSLAGRRAKDDAWKLTRVMVCDMGADAHRVIANHVRHTVAKRIEGITPETISRVGIDDADLHDGYAKGAAWGASAERAGSGLHVNFSTGETCWAGFNLRFDGRAWVVSELSGGCD